MTLNIKGSFKFLKWEESEVVNNTSTARVEYQFIADKDFIGNASYCFHYTKYSRENPLDSISEYRGL